jgi:ankyrin repeat protein
MKVMLIGWLALAVVFQSFAQSNSMQEDGKRFSKWPVPRGNIIAFFAKASDKQIMELITNNPALIEEKDDSDCTALHYAARFGRLEATRWFLANKADVNTVAYNKFTPMHVVTNGAVARILIKAGADLNRKDAWGKTPLQSASEMGYTNVCEAILESGFPLDLGSAIRLGKRDAAMKMLKEKPSLAKQVDEDSDLWANTSPLGIAVLKGDKEMVGILLKAGAPVNAVTERPEVGYMTPLCNAVWSGHYEIAQMLCEAGADCNMTGGKFYPKLLDYALKHSDDKMIALLVKFGATHSEDHQKSPK